METLGDLMTQLKILEQKIQDYGKKVVKHSFKKQFFDFENYCDDNKDEIRDNHRETLDYTKKHWLVTLTFDPKVVVNLDFYGQFHRLDEIVNNLGLYKYYACYEKHKSGILHAHLLIESDEFHSIYDILNKCKKYITKSVKMAPAIKYDVVKQTKTDIDSSYNYIWNDKKDHPKYKYIKINI